MNYTALVMRATIKNNFRWATVAAIIFGIDLICVVGIAALLIVQFISPEVKAVSPNRVVLGNFLSLILFGTIFCSTGIYASVYAAQSLIREKARGNIQALLSTPLKPFDICLGKTLGVFLPGLVFGYVMTLGMLLLINFIYIVPAVGFIITPWMIVTSFIAVPLMFLSLTLLVNVTGMAGKASTGNIIGQLPLSIIPALMINLAVRDVVSADSWLFAVILIGIAAIAGFFVRVVYRKLTAENIILSQ